MKTWNGAEVKALRKKLKITQGDLALALKSARSTISDIETGQHKARPIIKLFFELLDKGILTIDGLLRIK